MKPITVKTSIVIFCSLLFFAAAPAPAAAAGAAGAGRPSIKPAPQGGRVQLNKPLKRLADLAVRIMRCPGGARAGDDLEDSFVVVVRNQGTAPAENFAVDLVLSADGHLPVKLAAYSPHYSDDVLLLGGREHVAALAPGASLNLPLHGANRIPADTPIGVYCLGVVVDPGDAVAESDEANNTSCCRLKIAPVQAAMPNLVVSGFAHTGSASGPPECRLLVTIRNLGSAPVPPAAGALKVWVDGALVDTIPLNSPRVESTPFHDVHFAFDPGNPGKSRSVVSTGYIFPSSPSSQTYTVRATVDCFDDIGESDETDNTMTRREVIPAH